MKNLANGTLALGMFLLAQGAVAFYFRINILTGTRYGPSLTPVYIILAGVGVCVVSLTFKTIADHKSKNTRGPDPASPDWPSADR